MEGYFIYFSLSPSPIPLIVPVQRETRMYLEVQICTLRIFSYHYDLVIIMLANMSQWRKTEEYDLTQTGKT